MDNTFKVFTEQLAMYLVEKGFELKSIETENNKKLYMFEYSKLIATVVKHYKK